MKNHKFGGLHTQIKLEAVKQYINFYTTVLKNQVFKLHYIDPFAGSGECEIKIAPNKKDEDTEDAFEHTEHKPLPNTIKIDGSSTIALTAKNIFDEYHFVEQKKTWFKQLEQLKRSHPDKNIHLHLGDANKSLLKILNTINWHNSRAFVFIDPYGMETEWETLKAIANTKKMDVMYLFPLSGLYRQAANNYDDVDPEKAAAIDRMLGTDEWRYKFYKKVQDDMFGDDPLIQRTAGINDLVKFTRERLNTIFADAIEPRLLPDTGPVQFALFFAVSNPNAASLSVRGAKHILKRLKLSP